MNKKYVEFVNISEEQKAKIFSLAKGCFQKSFLEEITLHYHYIFNI